MPQPGAAPRERYGVLAWDAEELVTKNTQEVSLPDDFPRLVYLTFDLDGLDPAVLPATGASFSPYCPSCHVCWAAREPFCASCAAVWAAEPAATVSLPRPEESRLHGSSAAWRCGGGAAGTGQWSSRFLVFAHRRSTRRS